MKIVFISLKIIGNCLKQSLNIKQARLERYRRITYSVSLYPRLSEPHLSSLSLPSEPTILILLLCLSNTPWGVIKVGEGHSVLIRDTFNYTHISRPFGVPWELQYL